MARSHRPRFVLHIDLLGQHWIDVVGDAFASNKIRARMALPEGYGRAELAHAVTTVANHAGLYRQKSPQIYAEVAE